MVIVKIISSLFFASDQASYGRNSATEHMFNPLTGTTVAFVCTLIFHCIKEYNENVTKTTIKFEGLDHVDGQSINASCFGCLFNLWHAFIVPYSRIKQTWDNQSEKRQNRVAELLLWKVKGHLFSSDRIATTKVRAVATPYEQNLDDLDSDLEDWCGPSSAADRSFTGGAEDGYADGLEPLRSVYRSSAEKTSVNQEDDALARPSLVSDFSNHQEAESSPSFYMHEPTARENGLAKGEDNIADASEPSTNRYVAAKTEKSLANMTLRHPQKPQHAPFPGGRETTVSRNGVNANSNQYPVNTQCIASNWSFRLLAGAQDKKLQSQIQHCDTLTTCVRSKRMLEKSRNPRNVGLLPDMSNRQGRPIVHQNPSPQCDGRLHRNVQDTLLI